MSLSILSIRSSIAFASCTSWTNFKEDLSTSTGQDLHLEYACAKLSDGLLHFGGRGGEGGGLGNFLGSDIFSKLQVV